MIPESASVVLAGRCIEIGCTRMASCRGRCGMHYARFRRSVGVMPPIVRPTPEERFWRHVEKGSSPAGCWLWRGNISGSGRASFFLNKRCVAASRFSWELRNGPIAEGLLACHKCDNPICVNPSHLFLGTTLDNAVDKLQKNRARGRLSHPSTLIHAPRQPAKLVRLTPSRRFWSKVEKTSGCWNWTRQCNAAGYGIFSRKEALRHYPRLAHRVAWEMTNGTIPDGMLVCHTCDNPACVRPDHLFLGTNLENARDKESKGRGFSPYRGATHCKHGHEFTPSNTCHRKGGTRGRTCKTCRRAKDKRIYDANPWRRLRMRLENRARV
jgi:hypothetical protein